MQDDVTRQGESAGAQCVNVSRSSLLDEAGVGGGGLGTGEVCSMEKFEICTF